MKNIMIYAYTKLNLGDDLFIKVLCERYPNSNFIIFAPKIYKTTFKEISNLKVVSSDNYILRLLGFSLKRLVSIRPYVRKLIAKKCDASVYIGGSLFMQHGNWEKAYKDKNHMLIPEQPFYLLGANFGPYKDEEFYYKYRELFRNYTDICFRDKYSFGLFKDLENVRYSEDVIFEMNTKDINVVENRNIIISVIKPSNRSYLEKYETTYYEKIREIAQYYLEKSYNVTFMSFCEPEGDVEAINEVISQLPARYEANIKKYYYKTDIDKALELIGSCSMVIATRFHSMILGWVLGKPVLPIIYNEKMRNVIKDVGFMGEYFDFKNIHELDPSQTFENNKKQYLKREYTGNQFKELDKYLNV